MKYNFEVLVFYLSISIFCLFKLSIYNLEDNLVLFTPLNWVTSFFATCCIRAKAAAFIIIIIIIIYKSILIIRKYFYSGMTSSIFYNTADL